MNRKQKIAPWDSLNLASGETKTKEKYFQVTARSVSICGWTVKATSLSEARLIANGGPEWSDLDFDEPDDFEITAVKVKK